MRVGYLRSSLSLLPGSLTSRGLSAAAAVMTESHRNLHSCVLKDQHDDSWSPAAGTLVMHRRVPHSHPGVKPITIQAIPNRCHCTPTHQQRLTTPGQPASDTDSAMQAPSNQGRTLPLTRSGTFVKGQPLQNDSREQPSQAPQDSGDSDPSRPPRRRPRGSTRQPNLSLSGAAQSLSAGGHGAGHSPSTSATSSAYQGIPDGANPASDGRTVVVSGIRKGMPGPEARQGVMELCAQHGEVTACWLRKGKSSSWFGIAQFAEVILSAPPGFTNVVVLAVSWLFY